MSRASAESTCMCLKHTSSFMYMKVKYLINNKKDKQVTDNTL